MPRRKTRIEDSQIARDIFNELDQYAQRKGFYPAPHALFTYMTTETRERSDSGEWIINEPRYTDLTRGQFEHWFGRLVHERLIEVDDQSGAIRCAHLGIIELKKPLIDIG